jgi:hypothetical protein
MAGILNQRFTLKLIYFYHSPLFKLNLIRMMKGQVLSLMHIICLPSFGNSQTNNTDKHAILGINNWKEVIAKSTSKNKIITVDLSTEWC